MGEKIELGDLHLYIGNIEIEDIHPQDIIPPADPPEDKQVDYLKNTLTLTFQVKATNDIINKLFGSRHERHEISCMYRYLNFHCSRKRKQGIRLFKKYYVLYKYLRTASV